MKTTIWIALVALTCLAANSPVTAQTWQETQNLAVGGRSVALSGTTALLRHTTDALVFDTTTGNLISTLPGAYQTMGESVALIESTALIGNSVDNVASLYNTTTGSFIADLTANDAVSGDEFGISVALSGTTALIGAWQDDDNGFNSGSAYLFNTSTGSQIAKLTASDGAAGDAFGFSVALSGTTALVGANRKNSLTGAAYLFDTITGNQIAKLTASDGFFLDNFGSSVALSTNAAGQTTALVGSPNDDDDGTSSGSAYLFQDDGLGNWNQIAKLTANDGANFDEFGSSVALSYNADGEIIALIGASEDSNTNGSFAGSAYIFQPDGLGNLTETAKLTASDGFGGRRFGSSVALSGTTALVGSIVGSSYVFEAFLEGDFDIDGDVDGFDFLAWQRGESLDPLSPEDLADWEANFGTAAGSLAASSTTLPEPSTQLFVITATLVFAGRHRDGRHRADS